MSGNLNSGRSCTQVPTNFFSSSNPEIFKLDTSLFLFQGSKQTHVFKTQILGADWLDDCKMDWWFFKLLKTLFQNTKRNKKKSLLESLEYPFYRKKWLIYLFTPPPAPWKQMITWLRLKKCRVSILNLTTDRPFRDFAHLN